LIKQINYDKITSVSIKDRKGKTIDAVEFGIAETVLNGIVGIELEGFNKGVIVLIGVGTDEVFRNEEEGGDAGKSFHVDELIR
jgi:hypothetical protein